MKQNNQGGTDVPIFTKILLTVCALALFIPTGHADVVDRIVAVVNDEIITMTELDAAFAPYARSIEGQYKGTDIDRVLKQQKTLFLQQMINNLLIEQMAEKAGPGIKAGPAEVDAVFNDMLKKNNITLAEYQKRLAEEGQSIETVKKEIASQMLRMRLLRREVQGKIVVTDEEIGRYYDQHREEYEGKEAVRIFQILLAVPPATDAAARRKIAEQAQDIRRRIAAGDSPEAVIASGGGAIQAQDIGFIERGIVVPELEKAAFGLETGQISDVVETQLGYHILKATDRRGAGTKPLEVVRNEIKAKIEDEKVAKKYDEWIDDVRKKAFIDIRLQ